MRITQRPGDGHVDGSVAEKRGAVVAASGDAILRRDVICPSQRHQAVHQLARGEIGIVHRADHEPFANRRVGKALGLERGIRADESIDRENVLRCAAFPSQPLRRSLSAKQSHFLFGRPEERDVPARQVRAERPRCGQQRRATHAVVEAAAVCARAKQAPVFLRDGDWVAHLDAKLLDFGSAARADICPGERDFTGLRAAWPLKAGPVPAEWEFQHAGPRAACRVDQNGVAEKELADGAATRLHLENTVRRNRTHDVADFVHVCDEHDPRRLLPRRWFRRDSF